MQPVEISAGAVHLRPFEAADVDAVARGYADPDSRGSVTGDPRELAERWCRQVAPEGWARGDRASFAAVDSTSGALLGSIVLQDLDVTSRAADLSYWLLPEA